MSHFRDWYRACNWTGRELRLSRIMVYVTGPSLKYHPLKVNVFKKVFDG